MPDETTLALWLDDELTGAELASVEAWAATRPDQLEAREETRRYKAAMRAAMPASIEPPAPEIFNARIARAIEAPAAMPGAPAAGKIIATTYWRNPRSWFMPAAAAAGMLFAFWIGNNTATLEPTPVQADAPDVYVPESGVDAEWVNSTDGSGSVIVLTGVSAIPDSTDFSQTVYLPLPREIDRTADRGGRTEDVQ